MYRYEIGKYDVDSLISFSSKWFKNVKSAKVPIEKSWFDRTTDSIVRFLKEQEINFFYVLISLVSTLVLIVLIVLLLIKNQKSHKPKSLNKFD